MKVTGIIAEYNPFHKGHKYQIDTLKKKYQPDHIIVAMSGDFVQRGTPALMSKYERAHMALLQGADLVLELPAYFATASAETFARGGILLFATTGLVDSLCFGAENDDLTTIHDLAQLLNKEPEWYRSALLSYRKEGLSFPAARAKALPQYAPLLESPNNILAIEYLKSIHALNLSIEPLLIQRMGSGYHDTDISTYNASASAIRSSLFSAAQQTGTRNVQQAEPSGISEELMQALPEDSLKLLSDYQKNSAFLWEKDFSLLLHHALLRENQNTLLQYADMTPSLSNRLIQHRRHFLSWNDFCDRCKSKDITYTRISRILTHLLLGIRQNDLHPYLSDTTASVPHPSNAADVLPYLRILGFRQDAAPLLTALKRTAKAPVITSPAAAEELLSADGLAMLHTDIYASDLYRSVLTDKCNHIFLNEYQRKLLVV